jgi:DHA2 family metal-tetracycline-proton antiporter-like MFS transporter
MAMNRPASAPTSGRLVYALSFVLFFTVMNATMFNVALPAIAAEFGLRSSAVSWVATIYSVLYALGSLLYGKLADRLPLKRLITVGLLTFAAGSAFGVFADSYPMLLAARVIQAAGASCAPALVMLIPIRFFPPESRGRVMGTIASTLAFSAGIGPIVGGFIAGQFHWSGMFLVSLLAPVALPLIRRALPDEPAKDGGPIDWIGAGLLGAAVTMLMLSVTLWNGWLLAGAAALALLFTVRSLRAAHPFVRLALFRNADYTSGLAVSFSALFAVFGLFMVIPLMLGDAGGHGLGSQAIGFVLFPGAMSAALLGRFGGGLVDRRGSRFTLFVALGFIGSGMLALSLLSAADAWVVAVLLPLINAPFTFVQAAMAKSVSSTLPKDEAGVGMGVYNLFNFMAGAISGSVMSKLIEFDLSGLNALALVRPSTYGAIFLLLALLIALTGLLAWARLDRRVAPQPQPPASRPAGGL